MYDCLNYFMFANLDQVLFFFCGVQRVGGGGSAKKSAIEIYNCLSNIREEGPPNHRSYIILQPAKTF